eukprot:gnl/MRDRNA2_/MRDRNA2_159179_c0_seq1.p1 gnl/MRDRNA2_/MRDRNA2_159179_c0~~gnl/MRDRNA2_/MRDRNA2_159179_c0_seq1.p1  ORF type:complete len:252 (-),score=36.77 gnl/MRDRNA2_/MRDRNA2_159179_c0_seq1:366-1055(-)
MAEAGNATPGKSILDLCAAPGGKSFVIAQLLFQNHMGSAPAGSLTCNELEPNRRGRLKRVVAEYIPERLRPRVVVTPFDGKRRFQGLGQGQRGNFDAVLVDVPCSSERHWVLQAKKQKRAVAKSDWSPARCKRYASEQFTLVRSALSNVKVGGRVVYSTCSIAPVQNDDVVSRILKKFSNMVQVVDGFADDQATLKQLGAEKTQHGWVMLPDRSEFGPLYWAVLERTPM